MQFFIFLYCFNIISQYVLISALASLGATCARYCFFLFFFLISNQQKLCFEKIIQGILLFSLPGLTGSGFLKPSPSLSFSEFLECADPALLAAFRERRAIKTAQGSGAVTITALSIIYKLKRRTNK